MHTSFPPTRNVQKKKRDERKRDGIFKSSFLQIVLFLVPTFFLEVGFSSNKREVLLQILGNCTQSSLLMRRRMMSSASSSSSSFSTATKAHYEGDPNELEKDESGIKIKPRGLNIIWGQDKRYWRIPEKDNDQPVELIQVCWLEVTASVPLSMLEAGKKYYVSFEVSLRTDAFGWNEIPIHLMAKIGKGKYKWKSFNLATALSSPCATFNIKLDEPLQIDIEGNSGDKLYFGLYEVWRGRWKGGLLIHQAKVTPA